MATTQRSSQRSRSGLARYFSAEERCKRGIERLTEQHALIVAGLASNPEKSDELYERGIIPREMKLGKGILSATLENLSFLYHSFDGQVVEFDLTKGEQPLVVVSDPDYTNIQPQEATFSAADQTHRRALRLARRATAKHLANLQLIY